MRQYVKDGTIPSLLRHSFSLEILEFNCLTSQLEPFLDKAGCRTPPPTVTGRTRLFPTLNSYCFRRVESGVNGAWCWLKEPCSWVLFMADQTFSIMTAQKMRTFGYHYSKEPGMVLSTFLWPVSYLAVENISYQWSWSLGHAQPPLLPNVGVWFAGAGCPVSPTSTPASLLWETKQKRIMEKLAQVLQGHTLDTTHAIYHLVILRQVTSPP